MIPAVLAKALEGQAAVIRNMANGIRSSGHPIDLVLNGKSYPLHQLTSLDLDGFAEDLARDAEKLRTIYH